MNPPFSEPLRKHLLKAAEASGVKCVDGGVVVTVNGPRFSTKTESVMYRNLGGEMINMVSASDVKNKNLILHLQIILACAFQAILSKEAAMLYACVIIITGYDSWKDGAKVNQKAIKKQKTANRENIEKLLAACVRSVGERDWDKEIEDLKVGSCCNSELICQILIKNHFHQHWTKNMSKPFLIYICLLKLNG